MFEHRHKSGEATSSDDSRDTSEPPHSRTDAEPIPPKQGDSPEEDGVTNEDVWMLIRRFNKEIYHVKSPRNALPYELDLSRSSEDHFSPEKLRTTLEWFYTSVVVSVTNSWYHITWLRSWREPRRTGILCSVYFMAWMLDALTFLFTVTPAILILFPSLQPLLFPADPASELDSEGQSISLPRRDSLTGASEFHKGEAAEREAQNLVWDIAEVALDSARTEVDDQDTLQDISQSSHVESNIARERLSGREDETAQPMMEKVSKALVQAIRIISDITETYERFCNLLSPTPPFHLVQARIRLVSMLGLWGLCSLLIPSYWLIKSTTFLLGLLFFGDPLFQRSLAWLNRRYPDWKEEFDLKETLLQGVPTNAQLTLTLLRLGEMSSSPLAPPPGPLEKAPSAIKSREKPLVIPPAEALVLDASGLPFPGILKLVRFTIGIGIGLRLAFHRAIGVAGMPHPPHLIGLLRKRGWVSAAVGPLKFKAEFDHQRGTAVIDASLEPPVLYFTTHQPSHVNDLRLSHQHKGSILFQIAVPDIAELKKTEQLGWKQKLILEVTGGVRYSVDGLMVCGKQSDQSFHLMAMKERDQLFNRLVAMGAQYWESC